MGSSSAGTPLVIQYLNRLGLKPSKNPRQFWNDLEYKHGRRNLAALKQALENRLSGSATQALYGLKNQSLALSLDFTNYSADLYRRFFEWWLGLDFASLPPQRILDLGCDNGIVTCFLATLYPDATVFGVDIEEKAIACARELAQKLELHNVEFGVVDMTAPALPFAPATFDCIVSVRSFHEIVGGSEQGPQDQPPFHFAIEELLGRPIPETAGFTLQSVRALLRGRDAAFVSFERLPWMASVTIWADWLAQAGLAIEWKGSTWIPFHEVGQEQSMPVLVCRPGSMASSRLLDGVYALCAGDVPDSMKPGDVLMNEQAEAMVYACVEKRLLQGLEVTYPHGARQRVELWTLDGQTVWYERTNLGYRKMEVLQGERMREKLEELLGQTRATYEQQGLAVRMYDSNGLTN